MKTVKLSLARGLNRVKRASKMSSEQLLYAVMIFISAVVIISFGLVYISRLDSYTGSANSIKVAEYYQTDGISEDEMLNS